MSSDGRPAAIPARLDQPLQFIPFLRPQVWGGNRLQNLQGKHLAGSGPIGEAWEISGLAEHPSVVAAGQFAGQSLADLWRSRPCELAGVNSTRGPFPLLVKWLDCQSELSVQVHPDDALARKLLSQESGKSEAWVVIHAEPDACVYAGLRPGVTPDEVQSRLAAGTVADCLHSFTPKVGDCISLPAGTIHSAGGGVVFAEVQQPSDATFRLFDWNRLGLDGQPRALQVQLALKAIHWPQEPIAPVTPVPLETSNGADGELLLQTPQFRLERYTVGDPWPQPYPGEMSIWMVLHGTAVLGSGDDHPLRILKQGSSVLIPAAAPDGHWAAATPKAPCQLLCVRVPHASGTSGH